jgi:hypothetical protein
MKQRQFGIPTNCSRIVILFGRVFKYGDVAKWC